MEKIKSFMIDHDVHAKGFYLGGVSNNIFTYDLRFMTPNGGEYMDCACMHTIEHLMATVVRNSTLKGNVVYFGPMGCRTGFYLLMLGVDKELTNKLVIDCFRKCIMLDEVPGNTRKECGNYIEHDLKGAIKLIQNYLLVIDN